jgi:excisionase family DNA binding protein
MNEPTRSHPIALDDVEARLTLSVDEAASLLGLGRTAAYEAARRGEIPSRRLGRRVIIPVPAFLDWLGVSTPST